MSMKVDLCELDFSKEIVRRTYDNLQKYQGEYDVTMLITSLIGLIVIPRENIYKDKKIPEKTISKELLSKLQSGVHEYYEDDIEKSAPDFNQIFTSMRHAICHGGITFHGEENSYKDEPDVITRIVFTNKHEKDGHNFLLEIEIQVNDIKEIIDCIYKKIVVDN